MYKSLKITNIHHVIFNIIQYVMMIKYYKKIDYNKKKL